jgi:uncharacterized membrane protein/predicted flap endonuclease-1-like 5' DNA nuclease
MEKDMSNKNRNLIISYFPSADDALAAAGKLKDWDKEQKEVTLGGMGIITMKNGKLKTKKVGARAGGTGSKWGMILGAAAGIVSGGVTLVGGALAGLAAGAVGGSLFHKKLGMTDEDRTRMESRLELGGAALAVMVDDDELEPTRAKIHELGGDVEHYVVPETTMVELEQTTDIEDVDEGVEVEVETIAGAAALATAVSSLDETDAQKLYAGAIQSVEHLLERGATPRGRKEIAAEVGVDESLVLRWVNELDLARVSGIGVKYAALLEEAGVDTIPELAQRNPANLHQKLAEVNATAGIVNQPPSEKEVAYWVAQAKDLPRVITY